MRCRTLLEVKGCVQVRVGSSAYHYRSIKVLVHHTAVYVLSHFLLYWCTVQTTYVCPFAVDMTVIFTFSCSFACTGQHAALCVSMSQAVGSVRTALICGLHPTTSPMKALRTTSRCGDCCTPIHQLGWAKY